MSFVVSDPHKFHRAFLGEDPNDRQRLLYSEFPTMRGFASQDQDPSIFEAALVLALVQTFPVKQGDELVKSYLFVPASMTLWSGEQIRASATRMFGVLKEKKSVAGAKMLARLIKNVVSGSRVLQLRSVPERWSAFGFDLSAPLPEWMSSALIPTTK